MQWVAGFFAGDKAAGAWQLTVQNFYVFRNKVDISGVTIFREENKITKRYASYTWTPVSHILRINTFHPSVEIF